MSDDVLRVCYEDVTRRCYRLVERVGGVSSVCYEEVTRRLLPWNFALREAYDSRSVGH